MNDKKRLELIRKKNYELNNYIDELKLEIKYYKEQNNLRFNEDAFIKELENIKKEWLDSLKQLKEKNTEYNELIEELLAIRDIMYGMNFKIPWYKKILLKHKK